MKKWMALLMVCLLAFGCAAQAAEWPEGRSPAQPYAGVREVDLTQTMGYIVLAPRAKMPAQVFCGTLQMFLPREDIVRGEGYAHVYEIIDGESVEIATVDFSDPSSVTIRPMTESEMTALIWGSGTCVELRLPKSLEFGAAEHNYYVLMDAGGFTAANGKVASLEMGNPETAWVPVIEGDYGVSGMYYTDAPSEDDYEDEIDIPDEDEADEEADDSEEADEEAEPTVVYKTAPICGDIVTFDLLLGGDAVTAVVYSDNGSVEFPELEYSEACTVTGTIVKDEVEWGILFLDAMGAELADVKVTQ